jgi:hypothetical protein
VVHFLDPIQFGNGEMEQSCSELDKGLLHMVLTLQVLLNARQKLG